jgi:hypothetical protein
MRLSSGLRLTHHPPIVEDMNHRESVNHLFFPRFHFNVHPISSNHSKRLANFACLTSLGSG